MIKPTGPSGVTPSLTGALMAPCVRVRARASILTHHESCVFSIEMITFASCVGCNQPFHGAEMCFNEVVFAQ